MRGVMRTSIAVLGLCLAACSGDPGAEPDATAPVDGGAADAGAADGGVAALRGSVRLVGQSSHGGVDVSLRSPAGDEIARAVTADDGSFALTGAPVDGGSLRITRNDGYQETVPGVRMDASGAGVVVDGRVEPIEGLEIARGVRMLASTKIEAVWSDERILFIDCAGCPAGTREGRLHLVEAGQPAIEIGDGATCLQATILSRGRRALFLRRGPGSALTARLVDLEARPPAVLAERPAQRYQLPGRSGRHLGVITPAGGIETIDVETGAVATIHDGSAGASTSASFSPGGDFVHFGIGDAAMYAPVTGGPLRTLGGARSWYPPDYAPGDRHAFVSGSDRRLYWIRTGSDATPVPLLDGLRSAAAPGIGFFSPDGHTYYALARAVADPSAPPPPDADVPSTLFAIDVDTGAVTALASGFPWTRIHRQLGFSPDGRWLFYVADVVGDTGALRIRPANGGDEIAIATDVYAATLEHRTYPGVWFLADEQRVIFLSGARDGRATLQRSRIEDGRPGPPEVVATDVDVTSVHVAEYHNSPALGEFLVFTRGQGATGYTLGVYDAARDRTADLASEVIGRVGLSGSIVVRHPDGALRLVHLGDPANPELLDVTDQRGFYSVVLVRAPDGQALATAYTMPGSEETGWPLVLRTRAGRHLLGMTAGSFSASRDGVWFVDKATGDLRLAALDDPTPRTVAAGVGRLGSLSPDRSLLALVRDGGLTLQRRSDGVETRYLPQSSSVWAWRGDLALAIRAGSRFPFQDGAYWLDSRHARDATR